MRPYYKVVRLYIDAPLEASWHTNAQLPLTPAQFHHLVHVLRLQQGANLLLFNGREGEWLAKIAKIDKKHLFVHLERQIRKQPPPSSLIYCFAPLKQARLDYMIQKAVEMGAGILQPVLTQFTQSHAPNMTRMQANVIEAAQQCGILSLPHCLKPITLDDLLRKWPEWPFTASPPRHLIFCDEILTQERNTLSRLAELPLEMPALLIGPEGGFSDAERQKLLAMAFVIPIGLGERIMRADTAAVAAMALINAIFEQKIKPQPQESAHP